MTLTWMVETMRPYNFGAGPSMLPEVVMRQIQKDLLDWQGTGMSVMEISHRSQIFEALVDQVFQQVRILLEVPSNYELLLITNTARSQFAMVPQNLLQAYDEPVDYLVTGLWSQLAVNEASQFATVNVVARAEDRQFKSIPEFETWKLNPNAKYFYYCPNETIHGLECLEPPAVGDRPLVADMTSSLFSSPLQIKDYGLIFAGAQKNFGISGLTLVIIREDLIGNTLPRTPLHDQYKTYRDHHSLYATPTTFGIYVMHKVLEWVQEQGGVSAISAVNSRKAALLYDYIDSTEFYQNSVNPQYRSRLNIPFTLRDSQLDAEFLSKAAEQDLLALKGHRAVGGMRASLYNAMPESGVQALIKFMKQFAESHSQ